MDEMLRAMRETAAERLSKHLTPEDVDLIRTLARSRLDGRGMPNSKPGLWFSALEQIEQIVSPN